MSKSYLSEQINLISLTTNDFFTDDEYVMYEKIVGCINKIDNEEALIKENSARDPTIRLTEIEAKKTYQNSLNKLIANHSGMPRRINVRRLMDTRMLERDANDEIIWPEGITWRTLKTSRKISEFVSEESRAMGLKHKDVTFSKVIVKWKSLDILEQIVKDGFIIPVLTKDGTVEDKYYIFMTASAGQLRTDKIQCIEANIWDRIKGRLMCGLTFDAINAKGGINVNKILAYLALASSATEQWTGISIDKCIVIDDFEAPAEGLVDYIDKDYKMTRCTKETIIKHTDGIGMVLPKISRKNFMVRGPWIKGLLTSFDYLKFCKVHDVPPVIKDIYGKEYDLEKDDIQVIFLKSQFKLYNYYDSWDQYKEMFKANHCTLNRTNFEEDYIQDTTISYQMLQTLTDMSDEEIETFTERTHKKIDSLSNDYRMMLQALKANKDSINPYQRALALYPELLRDAYSRETIKAIKARWVLDAKSGRILCENKRLFAIPDMYAACQYWFLKQERPEGLLKNGEVSCKPYRNKDKVACLRSPHLYMEWAIRDVVHDQNIYDWFYTDGIYTSCHDLISKILQFDVDGDQLNVVVNESLITAAEREIEKYNIVPLLYELGKAPPHKIDREEMFHGLKRAHDYSGIGQVSNSLTKLWNKTEPDRYIAGCLTYYNNLVIDAAKTGVVNGFENYADLNKRVNKAIGGKNGRMPWFFQFSKNGRRYFHLPVKDRKKYAKENDSTMNRICRRFDDIGNINMMKADVPPFNWQMLLTNNDSVYHIDAIRIFCQLDDGNKQNIALSAYSSMDGEDIEDAQGYEFVKEIIVEELTSKVGSLEECYPTLVKFLFAGQNANKVTHKQMFWRVFGDIACKCLEENSLTYTVCEKCGMKMPAWVRNHTCPKEAFGFFECADCGAWCKRENNRQYRCTSCQEEYRKITVRQSKKNTYISRKTS